jgi:putative tryptophan/tyrosine transport system substrate-binding protein
MVFTEISAKELEILHEATPQAKRIGVFWNPTTPSHEPALKAVRAGAEILGIKLYEVTDAAHRRLRRCDRFHPS